MSASTRARIRQTAIDTMSEDEIRDLVAVVHAKIDDGYQVTEDVFEESIEEVFSTRTGGSSDDVERMRAL